MNLYNIFQDPKYCSLNDSPCYIEATQMHTSCIASCSGLYADVVYTEDKILTKIQDAVAELQNKGTQVIG